MSKRCLGCMELYGDEFEICPHCGYVYGSQAEEAIHMQPGSILHNRYIIGKVLGFGGFGITYIGWDGKLEQKVAIKEYLPGEFSTRMPGQSKVTVFNGEKSEQFNDGLKKFVGEAKRLAKFQNEPGIVTIFDSFEENDTAYIIMEYLDGETLTTYLEEKGAIPEEEAIEMIMPIMESLKVVHAEGILHRDIAPDNVFITKEGEIKLIDFGASRYATTSHSRSLTVIIKPGYSPEEQYRSRGDQGPHTDVYALAATLYKMLTGQTPPDAMERRAKYESQSKDILVEPHKIKKNISVNRENAILNAMNVRIEDRTPDIPSFISELNADPPVKRRYGKIKKIDVYSWPKWIKIMIPALLAAVLAFGVLLLTGVINFNKYTNKMVIPDNIVIAPDVEGMNNEEAIRSIEESGLLAVTGGSVESKYISAGVIIMQTPVGGSFIERNGKVSLVVSSGDGVVDVVDGKATVPYVLWLEEDEAIAKLLEAHLGYPKVELVYDDNVTAGQVISTSIKPGELVDENTEITITVSLGPEAILMPEVTGMTVDEAKETLEKLGLVVRTEYEYSSTVPNDQVFKQSVAGDEKVQRGDEVVLTVSSGEKTVTVPDVVGKTQKEAEDILKDEGFKVNVLENYSDECPKGCVISQDLKAGTSQIEGSTITITVSKGAQTIHVAGISLDKTSLALKIGDTAILKAAVSPDNATDKTVKWSSSNSRVVTVDSNGTVKAVGEGNATITVKTNDGKKTATCSVEVTKTKVSVTGVSLDKTSLNMTVGDHATLKAKVSPADATDQSVKWTTSNEKVATVNSSGKVTAVGAGQAVITVTTNDGNNTAKCTVDVKQPVISVTGVSLTSTSLNMVVGQETTLIATVSPHNATDPSVTWKSSNSSVATVNNGKVTAVGEGNATIIVTTNDGGKTAACTVSVKAKTINVTGVSLNLSSWSGFIGNNVPLTATVTPSNATDKSLTWSSSNTTVATVDKDGVVRTVGLGEAVITVKTKDGGYTASCSFKVQPKTISVTGVSLNVNYWTGIVDDTLQLTATITPSNATDTGVTWSSSNNSVATVNSNGKVRAVGAGNATITVKTNDGGYTATCVVVISPKIINVTGVTLNTYSWSGYIDDSIQLTATVNPSNATDKSVTWSSSNSSVATVNSNGKVTAVGAGNAYITVKTNDGGYTATCSVTVSRKSFVIYFNANGGTASASSMTCYVGQALGNLPSANKDYNNFKGWWTSSSGGSQITSSTVVNTEQDFTVYAHWELKPVSDWVLYSNMPSGAQIVDEKWTYTLTTTIESSDPTAPSGYSLVSSRWEKTGSGSFYYSQEFPSGFDSGHELYSYNRGPYSAYENSTNKREVSTSWAGYIYWHWMYDTDYANGSPYRAIYHKKGTGPDNGFYYKFFGAFTSTKGDYENDTYYCNSQGIRNYIIPERTGWDYCQGATRWFRFNYNKCSYTDYKKVFVYQKTENLESYTEVFASSTISNVKHWVRYREK